MSIRLHPMAPARAPDEAKTPEACAMAVEGSREALEFVPDGMKTQETCESAVSRRAGGGALVFVPEALKTEALCREAVLDCPAAPQSAPESFRTPELCRRAPAEKECGGPEP